jgi:hypothetical protein
MILSDLREIKSILEIDPLDNSEDKKLLFLVEQASALIEGYLDRDLFFKSRTQFYKGTGTQKLLLRNRPVYPTPQSPYSAIQVTYDPNGLFGAGVGAFANATTLSYTYGVDYTLQIDQDDGGSRSGILIRINEYWTRPQVRQAGLLSPFVGDDTGSLQVIYTAGYTVDTLPAAFRAACNLLVARMRYLMPVGMEIGSEGYEERSISLVAERKDYLMSLVKPLIHQYRNWKF